MSNTTPAPIVPTSTPIIRIANGTGKDAIDLAWSEGMTVSAALIAAEITVKKDHTVTLGRRRITDPDTELLQPNDILVIAGMPGNG